MYLLELAAQGIRDFGATVRAPLRPGYLHLQPSGAVLPPLCSLALAILFPDGRGGEISFLAPGAKLGKVGFTVLGNDQVTYRVIRQLGGAGILQRFNKTSQVFERVTEDPAETNQLLRAQAGLPTRTAFEQLFTLTPSQSPSRKPKARPATGVSGIRPALASSVPVAAAADVGGAQAKLQELERERALSDEVDKLQFRADGIASQLFEMEGKLKGSEGVKAALAQAEADYAAAPTPDSLKLPPDVVERAQKHAHWVQRRDESLAKLEADKADEVEVPEQVESLTANPQFWGGAGGGLAFLGLGALLQGSARYVALLDIPAFSFAALLALKYVDDVQGLHRVSRKGGMRTSREKKIRDEFDAETRPVRDAMKALNVETPKEVAEVFEKKGLLLVKVNEYREQLQQLEADPEYAQAAAKQQKLKTEQEAVNEQLTEKGAYVRDVREVEREIGRLKESIALARSGSPAQPAPSATATAPSGPTFEDPSPALFKLATDILQADTAAIGALLRDRCTQYLSALTDRRFTAIEFDKDGHATVVSPTGKVPLGEVPGRDLDLIYWSLRLTLIEKASAHIKIPVLIEDTLGFDEMKLSLLGRMLKHLGTLTQVLHVSSHATLAQAADAAVTI